MRFKFKKRFYAPISGISGEKKKGSYTASLFYLISEQLTLAIRMVYPISAQKNLSFTEIDIIYVDIYRLVQISSSSTNNHLSYGISCQKTTFMHTFKII